ncbi:MFS transporter [Pseudoxanthomonas kaohsiungensis]|uniref:MFS transporter n=1 Tax=Pseudoxanthomonas kaohsiungensis TaxID=283923 RepID=A0ABW3LZ55_9GAMM|nr:MFS transporter [Pseudoxanthomonas kaohsiungensis]KAF1701207.1 MFS transporter [Pseudoxanthomonas kaohsiungensis]
MPPSTTAVPAMDRNWSLVAAGAVLGCVGVGALFSLAVLLQPMGSDTGWSRAGLSAAMTVAFLASGFAGFGWGALGDRIGPRPVVLAGSVLLGLALVLASRATTLLQFQLTFGLLLGVAVASFFAPVMAATAAAFDRRRNLAIALVSAGVGVAPMTMSPLVAWLLTQVGWRETLLVLGLLCWALTLPAAWFVRAAPVGDAHATGGVAAPGMTMAQALRSKPFIVLALAFFACCAAHSGPIFHTVSYAVGCGLSVTAAVTIYSMEGAAGLGGRLLFGLLGDRYGAKPVLVAGLAIQALAAVAYLAVERLGGFYAVAFVFGLAYGGTMPLYASLAREAFPPRILGGVIGAMTMLSGLGMALGPLLGGWLFDRYGSYAWMYVGSLMLGLAAAAVVTRFPRSPSRKHEAEPGGAGVPVA